MNDNHRKQLLTALGPLGHLPCCERDRPRRSVSLLRKEIDMSTRSRILHLPSAMDTRTCSRWACLNRIPGSGPDPAILNHHVQRTVTAVAAIVIEDAEVKGSLQATAHYVAAFLDRYWPGIPALVGPGYPTSLVAAEAEKGAVCIETLVERVVPRLQYTERLLAHTQSFEWRIPDGAGGELVIPGVIARLGEGRLSGTIRIYDWQIEQQRSEEHTSE